MIASNFGYAAQKKISLRDVEPEIFLQIIQCEDLRVFSEDDIFIGIADYVGKINKKLVLVFKKLKLTERERAQKRQFELFSEKFNFLSFQWMLYL